MNLLPFLLMTFLVAISSAIIKIITDSLNRAAGLFVQYFFCALYSVVFWAFFDGTMFSITALIFVALILSPLNYLGAYCQWAAYKMNMARTSLFQPLSGVLTIILFWIFLKEYQNLSYWALAGVGLHLVAIWMFISAKDKSQSTGRQSVAKWLFYTAAMVITVGIINFFMKIVSQDISKTHFLLLWYCGTFIFSALSLLAGRGSDTICPIKRRKVFLLLPLCSLVTMSFLGSLYWAYQTNPGTSVASYSALNFTFVPAVMGWVFFKEAKKVKRTEIAGLICGIVAAVLIIASH